MDLRLRISLPIDTVFQIQVAQMRFRRKLSLYVINLAVSAEVELQINDFDSLSMQISLKCLYWLSQLEPFWSFIAVAAGDPFVEACGVTAFDIGTNHHGIIDLDVMSPQNGSIFVKVFM